MVRFWSLFLEPFARALRPGRIMEIGAGEGATSRLLLGFCQETDCRLDLIDPQVSQAVLGLAAEGGERLTVHGAPADDVLRDVEHPDLVLMDGDPNWYSVFTELTLLWRLSQAKDRPVPCVMVHNVGWPYGRRDMYHDPARVPARQAFAYQGVEPGVGELTESGVNGRFAHALAEGGERNGVLTAVEDFVESIPEAISIHRLPFFNGLAILTPEARMTPELQTAIAELYSTERLLAACESLEQERLTIEASRAALQTAFERQASALARAKALIEK